MFHAPDIFVHPAAPAGYRCALWISVPHTTDTENSGIVLFSEQGDARLFIPMQDAASVTAVSLSPRGRIIAVLREERQKIDFFSCPEIQYTGTINAIGPVLWKDSRSGTAFTPGRKIVGFSMIPDASSAEGSQK